MWDPTLKSSSRLVFCSVHNKSFNLQKEPDIGFMMLYKLLSTLHSFWLQTGVNVRVKLFLKIPIIYLMCFLIAEISVKKT